MKFRLLTYPRCLLEVVMERFLPLDIVEEEQDYKYPNRGNLKSSGTDQSIPVTNLSPHFSVTHQQSVIEISPAF